MNKTTFLILLKVICLFKRILILSERIVEYILFKFNLLETYFKQEECKKFKDCILLCNLIKNQPPASDRYIEYPWMLENIKITSGKILDIGSTICDRLFKTLPKTIEIHGINLNEMPLELENNKIRFKIGDIRKTDYPNEYFDYITCISTLEHIGQKNTQWLHLWRNRSNKGQPNPDQALWSGRS